jgi:hypothetical protein
MLPRLDELESDLEERRKRAAAEGWLGEIEGVDLTLQCLRDKRADALRLTRITRQVDLGMPAVGAAQWPSQADRSQPAEPCRGRSACELAKRTVSGMSGGRPAVSYRSLVPLDTLCDTYGLADEVIGDPAGAAESGTPA